MRLAARASGTLTIPLPGFPGGMGGGRVGGGGRGGRALAGLLGAGGAANSPDDDPVAVSPADSAAGRSVAARSSCHRVWRSSSRKDPI